MVNKDLKQRIVNISYVRQLSHLGSCLTAVDIIDKIYSVKGKTDKFILDNAHAALALYTVLEKHEGRNAEMLFDTHGVHQNKDLKNGIFVSGGSLGLAGAIACGMAKSDYPNRIWCVTSDGALAEGIWWETLRVAAEQRLDNLKLVINVNGFSALGKVDYQPLIVKFQASGWGVWQSRDIKQLDDGLSVYMKGTPIAVFYLSNMDEYPQWLRGVRAHYEILDEDKHQQLLNIFL